MPPPVVGPCGGDNQPPCPPVNSVMQALSDLVVALENDPTHVGLFNHEVYSALAAAHALVDPLRKP